jgi:hypothetical protein
LWKNAAATDEMGKNSNWNSSLYHDSPKGNPTLTTLIAVFMTVGLWLSVTPQHQVRKRQSEARRASAVA